MQPLNVNLDRPIADVTVLGGATDAASPQAAAEQIENQKAQVSQLCATLANIVETLNDFQTSLISGHKDDIAKLAVEIAAKILARKVEQGDYEIEAIIKQALEGVEIAEDIVVRLNPKDHAQIKEMVKSSQDDSFKSLVFVADSGIAPAECLLETPQGKIESHIEEQLNRVTEALINAG